MIQSNFFFYFLPTTRTSLIRILHDVETLKPFSVNCMLGSFVTLNHLGPCDKND